MHTHTHTHTHTSEVADEVRQLHLALLFDGGVVQVRVEHDDGEGEQEDGVGGAEQLHLVWVARAVAQRERLHQTLDLLRLALRCAKVTSVPGGPLCHPTPVNAQKIARYGSLSRPLVAKHGIRPCSWSERWLETQLDFQVENQPRAAYIGRTALVCVEECVHSVMFLKKELQA